MSGQNKSNHRELWNNFKRFNMWVVPIPEGGKKGNKTEKIFEEIMAENFPNLMKDIHL